MKPFVVLSASLAVLLTACQSVPTVPVFKRADQSFETTGLGKTKVVAQRSALTAAQKQCGLKSPVILKDTARYNGVLDEKTGRIIEQGVGVVGAVLGTRTPSITRDDDYEYQITFKCQ